MTAPRQERNWRLRSAFIALLAAIALHTACGFVADAATTERVVVSRYTGLAIEGYDPVAYFTDSRAIIGRASFEASEAGAVWRFSNEGNRTIFTTYPEIYSPKFGGYDPVDVARGVSFPGNPRLWAIYGQRLYLFGRQESRDAFLAAPDKYVEGASLHWPDLQETLAQ